MAHNDQSTESSDSFVSESIPRDLGDEGSGLRCAEDFAAVETYQKGRHKRLFHMRWLQRVRLKAGMWISDIQ